MKKSLLIGAIALCGAINAQSFGAKAGLNVSSINTSDNSGSTSKVGFYGGFFLNAPLSSNFSIQPELLYNAKGAKEKGNGGEKLNLDYISVPVMFQYNVIPNLYLEAGPEFSFNISAKYKGGTADEDVKDAVKSFDFGIGLGAGYYFTPKFGVTARYVAGVTDFAKSEGSSSSEKTKNNVFQVGLAYKFK